MARQWVEVPARPKATVHPPEPPAPPASGGTGRASSEAQNALYHRWIQEGTALVLRLRDGTTLEARLLRYDTYALHLLAPDGREWLVFKHAVNAIVPPAVSGEA